MKILLADDQPEMRSLVAEVLRDQGHHVLAFEDGRKALQRAPSQGIDLLITDFDMPGIDGVELCRRLRKGQPGLPAVLISSRCGDADWAPSEPMVCLPKPFRRQQLLDALDQAQWIAHAKQEVATFEPNALAPMHPATRYPNWALGLAAALLLLVGGASMFSFSGGFGGPPSLPEPNGQTTLRHAAVQLLAPVGVLAQLPDAATWQPVPNADAYRLRFETVDGRIVFETRAAGSPWPFPEALRRQLPANVAFHWQVEALSDAGQLLARSPRTRFRVVAPMDVDESTSSEAAATNPTRTP